MRGNIELTPRYTDAILEDVEYYKSLGLKGIRSGYFGVGVLELFEYPNDHSLQSGVFPGSVKYPSILSEYDLPGPYSDALRRLSIDISDNRVVLLPFGLAPSKFNHNLAESSIPYGAGGYRREKPQRAYPEYHGNRYNRTRYREYCQPALQGVNIPPGPRRVVDGSDNRDYHYTHYDKYGAPIPYNGPQLRSYDRPVPGPVAQMNDHPRSDGNWRVHGTKSRRYDSDSGEYDQYEYPDARSYNRQRSNDANGPMNVTNNQQNSYNYRRNQGNNGGYRRHPFYSNERW